MKFSRKKIYFLLFFSTYLLKGMVNTAQPIPLQANALSLFQYRPKNAAEIMLSHYDYGMNFVRSISDVKRYQHMRFNNFEHTILPLCIEELKQHNQKAIYRMLFKNMLVHEINKVMPLAIYLANKFTEPASETPELTEQIERLNDELKRHEQIITQILNSSEISYEQLAFHCTQKTYIYSTISDLQLTRYKE